MAVLKQYVWMVPVENQRIPSLLLFHIFQGMGVTYKEINSVIIETSDVNDSVINHFLKVQY